MWSAASHGAQLPLHGVRVGGTSKHMGQRLQGHRPWAWGTGPGGDTIGTPGTLGWMLSCVMFRAARVDPERRWHKGA